MKALITPLEYRYQGLIPTLKEVFEVKEWDNSVPIFDFFDENSDAEIIFCSNTMVDSNFLRAIDHLNAKRVIFGNMIPVEMQCDLVCAAPSISPIMKKNLEAAYNTLYISDFVDAVNDIGGIFNPDLESDIGYVCVDNAFNMEEFKLLLKISSIKQLKMIGSSATMALPQFLGIANKKTELDFIHSVKIALDLHGSNILKLSANGIFTLSTLPNSLFPSINIHNCKPQIEKYIGDIHTRFSMANEAKKQVLQNATSYHRVKDIVEKLNLDHNYHMYLEEEIQDLL